MVGVIDYGMGNLRSVLNALEHLGADACLISTPDAAGEADRLVLPGVGAFGRGMANLAARGFADELGRLTEEGRPLLGICLGMQLLATTGTEHGAHEGLGLIPGVVRRLDAGSLRIPHVGWNGLQPRSSNGLLAGLSADPTFYFVHSYEFQPDDPNAVTATTDYGGDVVACVQRGAVFGVQFHPEKSQADGMRLLGNFMAL
jgi:imidazole glycerol-phosphate synthase subunit HisH